MLVMAEIEMVVSLKKSSKPRRLDYLKMKVINDLKMETFNRVVQHKVSGQLRLYTNDSTSYVDLYGFVQSHDKIGGKLPWLHIAVSNTKPQLLYSYHNVKPEF